MRQRILSVGLLVCGVVLGLSTTAWAHHIDSMFPTAFTSSSCSGGGMGTTYCQTDNAALSVFRESSIGSTGRVNIAQVLNSQYDLTDLSVSFPASPVYTGSSETDVIYQRSTAVGANAGVTWCNDAVSSTKCDQHYVAFGDVNPSPGLACHESGHAVGLSHGHFSNPQVSDSDPSLACMTTPVLSSVLGTHNTGAINATY
jgi:hypothetical protein